MTAAADKALEKQIRARVDAAVQLSCRRRRVIAQPRNQQVLLRLIGGSAQILLEPAGTVPGAAADFDFGIRNIGVAGGPAQAIVRRRRLPSRIDIFIQFQVEAHFDGLHVLADAADAAGGRKIQIERRQHLNKACRCGDVDTAEIRVVVFQPERPGGRQRLFHAGANRPSPSQAVDAGGDRRKQRIGGEIDPLLHPGGAALGIYQGAPAGAGRKTCPASEAAGRKLANMTIGRDEKAR